MFNSSLAFAFDDPSPPVVVMAALTMASELAAGRVLTRSDVTRIMTEHFGGSDALGSWSVRDAHAALELAQVQYLRSADQISLSTPIDEAERFCSGFAAGMDPECSIRRIPMTNLVILVGRIARDPETRTTQGGTSITSVSVVTDRPARKEGKTYKDENGYTAKDSEFHRITCFNGLGENVAKYCTRRRRWRGLCWHMRAWGRIRPVSASASGQPRATAIFSTSSGKSGGPAGR
jgi:hypothetical protein